MDSYYIDSDHDGAYDMIAWDTNSDGLLDTYGVDTNHDGYVDVYGYDTNEDGQLDSAGVDANEDGVLDSASTNTAYQLDSDQWMSGMTGHAPYAGNTDGDWLVTSNAYVQGTGGVHYDYDYSY